MRADDPSVLRPLLPAASEAPTLAAELLGRFRARPPIRGISVTELLDPRSAYWQSVHPVPATPEQADRQRDGRRVHERLARALAPLSAREVRVRRDGVVGRIDVLEDRPVEIKSTGSPPPSDADLRTTRPAYVEQVVMYAALLDRSLGRLILVGPNGAGAPLVWDLEVRDAEAVRREMLVRVEQLRGARDRQDPSRLPRCPWYGRGCAFQREGVCRCDGTEPELTGSVLEAVDRPTPNPAGAERVASALRSAPADGEPIARFRDIAYPRRGYFEARGTSDPAAKGPEPGAPGESWSALHDLLEDGPPGEFEYRSPVGGAPEEAVPTFRGDPCLVKSTRSTWATPAERLVADRPHYVLELALRCAAVGATAGWVLLGFDRLPSDGAWIGAQRLEFGSPESLSTLLRSRVESVRSARQRSDPVGLPACPAWMPDGCPYRTSCGCASDVGRA